MAKKKVKNKKGGSAMVPATQEEKDNQFASAILIFKQAYVHETMSKKDYYRLIDMAKRMYAAAIKAAEEFEEKGPPDGGIVQPEKPRLIFPEDMR